MTAIGAKPSLRKPAARASSGGTDSTHECQDSMSDIAGRLETIAGRVVEGWAVNLDDPARPVVVEVFDGDRLLGSTIAWRVVQEQAPEGDTPKQHEFSFLLPLDVFDGQEHVIAVRPAGSAEMLQNSPVRLVGHDPHPRLAVVSRKAPEIPSGSLDLVSDEGWVLGWAWYPNSPEERVEIELLVDGELAGSTTAASYRADVAAAGVGDGNYGFSWALPYHVLTKSRESLIAARDKKTGHILPEPRRFRQLIVSDALEKVATLENDLRQLNAAIALSANQLHADQRDAAELFRTVGDFFVQLAEATAAGQPPGSLKTLRGAVADVTAKFRPFSFNLAAAPEMTICLEAGAKLPLLYQQLRQIRDSAGGVPIELILIDGGRYDDTPLLPLVVRNIRYLRSERAAVARVNEAMQAASAEIVVFITELAAPAEAWLEGVDTGFAEAPSAAALAAKVLGTDGVLEHAGVMMEDVPVLRGYRRDPDAEAFLESVPVDAVAPESFALRRDIFHRLRGLDEHYAGLGAALADFCLRARVAGLGVHFAPGFSLVRGDETAPNFLTARDDEDRLRQAVTALQISAA
jgi:hypothetical protein